MLGERLNAAQARLDALLAGQVRAPGLVERARLLLRASRELPSLSLGCALDRDLDTVGIHTSADAKLLRGLVGAKGRVGALSKGLRERAAEALEEYELALNDAGERLFVAALPPGRLTELGEAFQRLARVVKVAVVFSTPERSHDFAILTPARARLARPPASARLAAAEFLAERARRNVDDTARKRRDLDLAHELLLRLSTDATSDRDRLRRLRIDVGAARERVRSAPVVRSLDDLARHVRYATRKDPRTAWRSVRSLYERAIEAGDEALAGVAAAALSALAPDGPELTRAVSQAEARRTLGLRDAPQVDIAPPLAPGGTRGVDDRLGDLLSSLAFDLDEGQQRQLELAAGTARYFDVEDALSEAVVEAEVSSTRPVRRRVPYPTQLLTFEHASSLDQVNDFVIDHPGSLLLSLASGQQMVRAYLEEEPPRKPKAAKKTAVRVYVLDASGSMHGARARFRDAILIAELNALRLKAKLEQPFDPLYFCFFNDTPSDLVRVDSADDATRRISQLFVESPAQGQTDISYALLSAFDSIRNAQGKDPYLARATVVLVTDGEDGVDLELIRATRRPFESLDIALSFISLGEENADLKALVLEQREQGSRAFYHHLTDEEIALARTEFDSTWRTLLPMDVPVGPAALERLAPHLEALEAVARKRAVAPVESASDQFDALFPATAPPGRPEGRLVTRLTDILDAVSEAASLAPLDSRASEAVALLIHLLGLYAIPVPRYLEALGAPEAALTKARERVRLLCRPFA